MTTSAYSALARLAAETSLREGPTPDALENPLLVTPVFTIAADAFLLALPSGLCFHYRKGEGVAFSRPAGIADAEVALFHHGSVYGAAAWINGLVPLHASAVVHEGRVHAFTGVSGAGKSTLAAALTQRGLPLFADDVLVLDGSDPARPMALPGHKRLKLWSQSLELTGLTGDEAVREDMDKYFVQPPLLDQEKPLPFASLYFLEDSGTAPAFRPLAGAERFQRMRGAFYRARYAAAVLKPAEIYALAVRLGMQTTPQVFDRSLDRDQFGSNVDFMAAAIRASHG